MAERAHQEPIPESRAALDRLASQVSGRVLTPGDADFDEARAVWNGLIDCVPHVTVRAASADDIPLLLEAARETQLSLAVRGGGHSVAGLSTIDDGIVLDLGALRAGSRCRSAPSPPPASRG